MNDVVCDQPWLLQRYPLLPMCDAALTPPPPSPNVQNDATFRAAVQTLSGGQVDGVSEASRRWAACHP